MLKNLPIYLLAASLSFYGCQQQPSPEASGTPAASASPAISASPGDSTPAPTASATPEKKAGLPYDLTSGPPNAKPGQFVFVPMASSVEGLMAGEDTKFSDMRPRELVKTGEETSTIKDGKEFEAPNSLIIPTQPDAKAANGDIVLCNPQYSSWRVAIVTDASDPTKPVVHFFKPVYKGQTPEGDKFVGQLEPGKFRILKDALEPGTHALYPDGDDKGYGQVIHVNGDKALVEQFGGELAVFNTVDLTAIPVKAPLKKGDKVQAPFAAGTDPGTVSKVDEKIGRVWVTFDGRESQGDSIFCFGEVLPAQ